MINKIDIFFEIHKDIPREGPGDSKSTQRAFSLLKNLPSKPKILDIGCGPGKQTFDLIKLTDGNMVAIDNHQPYIDSLNEEIVKQGLTDRIQALNKDMFNLDFEEKSFDVIWAEGAIYIIGFENGLKTWPRFLKTKGHIAATEISWLKPNPPDELKTFWDECYPNIQNIESNLEIIKRCGYKAIDYFPLPESAWWDDYYNPIQQRITKLKEKYHDNEDAIKMIELEEKEINIYKKYSAYYGYVFYIMQLS